MKYSKKRMFIHQLLRQNKFLNWICQI